MTNLQFDPLQLVTLYNRRVKELESENDYLKTLVQRQAETITELQWRVDPYSSDGEALCNSYIEKDYL